MEQGKEYKFKTLDFNTMAEYIEEKAPQDKEWFMKESCILVDVKEKDGTIKKVEKYNHLQAKRVFCERYMPEILPKKKDQEPAKVATRFAKWKSEK
jgi:hypothetical protein